MLSLHVNETISFCAMVNLRFPMVEIPFPDASSSKSQSVDLLCFSTLMLSSVQSLVISSQQSTKSDVLKFGPVPEQGAETRFRKETAIFFAPNLNVLLIDHHNQQIVRQKARNLQFCFGTNVGTNQAKIEKISISRAIRFGFLRSPASAIRCEANKNKTMQVF